MKLISLTLLFAVFMSRLSVFGANSSSVAPGPAVLDSTTVARSDQPAVPFPAALDAAAISVDRLDSILEHGLLLGNGDLNTLVSTEGGQLVFMLTKNDVWDARLDSKLDPPLPTLALIKKLAVLSAPQGDPQILADGWGKRGADSYHAHPYPCPRPCARLILGDRPERPVWRQIRAEGSQNTVTEDGRQAENRFAEVVLEGPRGKRPLELRDLAAPSSPAQLDLFRAWARTSGAPEGVPPAEVRVLADRNVLLIKSNGLARLAPISSPDTPLATSGEDNGTLWLAQQIPGDEDWPGMSFAVAVASRGQCRAVAIVTSREAKDPRVAAVGLARAAAAADTAELVRRHEADWARFWSASGIKLDDPVLEAMWYRNLYFLRCVSKPGAIAPGLYASLIGVNPAWHGDYHTNYNIQQTFWGAYAANHCELAEPYDRLIREYLPRAQWLCRQVFSLPGAYYPHVLFAYEPPDPAACRSPLGRQYIHHVWGFTLGHDGGQ